MEPVEISHREIYDRLVAVEGKVDDLTTNTANVVAAFNAASGAFKVLDFLGKIAKPILFVGGLMTALGVVWQNWRGH